LQLRLAHWLLSHASRSAICVSQCMLKSRTSSCVV
jgi:hypothetical protein